MTIADADHLQAKRSPRAGVVNGRGRPIARRALDRARVWLAQRSGPPRVLMHSSAVNVEILRAFGAHVGDRVRVHAPVVLHEAERGFSNLSLGDGCLLSGNNFIDLSGRVTLEPGVSLGPGVTVMTHNRFNYNSFLEGALAHQCGVRDIVLERGAGIKAGAIVVMGVTVGQCSVVAAGAVVNRDVPPYGLVAGIPAREIQRLDG